MFSLVESYRQVEGSGEVAWSGGGGQPISSYRSQWWVEKRAPEAKYMAEWWRASSPLQAHYDIAIIKDREYGPRDCERSIIAIRNPNLALTFTCRLLM